MSEAEQSTSWLSEAFGVASSRNETLRERNEKTNGAYTLNVE